MVLKQNIDATLNEKFFVIVLTTFKSLCEREIKITMVRKSPSSIDKDQKNCLKRRVLIAWADLFEYSRQFIKGKVSREVDVPQRQESPPIQVNPLQKEKNLKNKTSLISKYPSMCLVRVWVKGSKRSPL